MPSDCSKERNSVQKSQKESDVILLRTFQQWVRHLDWNDLQHVLVFRVRSGSLNGNKTVGILKDRNNFHSTPHHRDEYDMLQDMVRLQEPLPTPIHPRAILYEPASNMGRNYIETKTRSKVTITRRWLRLIPNHSDDEAAEEKLWAMLQQQQPNAHDRSKYASRTQRKERKNAKKSHPIGSVISNPYFTMDIIARQFRLADGTVLTVPTRHNGDADTALLVGTVIQQNLTATPDDTATGHDNEDYYCRFCPNRSIGSSRPCFDLLRYTTRGAFATVIMSEHEVDEQKVSMSFPSWFDPTDRWFPLSMYLSARYEMALWRAFYHWSYHRSLPTFISPTPPNESERSMLHYTHAQSLSNTLKDTFCHAKKTLSPSSFHIRDMLLWNELVNTTTFTDSSMTQTRWIGNDTSVSPILELGTSMDVIRQQVRSQLQLLLTNRAMEQLLASDDLTGAISDETRAVQNTKPRVPPHGSNVKPRNGKKKPRKKYASVRKSQQQEQYVTQQGIRDLEDETSTSSADVDDVLLAYRVPTSDQCHVGNKYHISDRQRSRHIVLAMSLLEDILSNVFRQVGVTSSVETVADAIDESAPFSTKDHSIPNKLLTSACVVDDGKKDIVVLHESTTNSDAHEIHHVSYNYDVWETTPDRIVPSTEHVAHESIYSRRAPFNLYPGDPSATIRTSNLEGFSSMEYHSFTPGFFKPPDTLNDTNVEIQRYLSIDGWGRHQGIGRSESILSDFFHDQDNNQTLCASSTAASIASSDKGDDRDITLEVHDFDCDELVSVEAVLDRHSAMGRLTPVDGIKDAFGIAHPDDKSDSGSEFHSPSPPSTPSPTLSPILVSLSEIGELPIESLELLQIPSTDSLPVASLDLPDIPAYVAPTSSFASEPVSRHSISSAREFVKPKMKTSSSRENLKSSYRPTSSDGKNDSEFTRNSTGTKLDKKSPTVGPLKCRDDHDIIDKATVRRSADALQSYRNIVMSRSDVSKLEKDFPRRELKRLSSHKTISAIKPSTTYPNTIDSPRKNVGRFHFDLSSSLERNDYPSCCRSDIDGLDDYQTLRDGSVVGVVDNDNYTVTKDGATTISSGSSQRESEEVALLREQRNVYRDMCLTLGSEVAKLKNLLAAQACTSFQPVLRLHPTFQFPPFPIADSFDPKVFQIAPRAQTLAAMSDAGYRGEYESLASEDEFAARMVSNENILHLSSGLSLNTVDQNHFKKSAVLSDPANPRSPNFLQSRLARDIFQFLDRNTALLRQLDGKIQAAVERMSRLVKTVWPRAQVKLYGSHVTGLSVVSSDLDFVVCLPAVHKNDVAVAPGALEGRNAINESSQKLLARRLKGESWIDPRSMKLIERTAVPVIKVSTKDTKKNTLHLDISFDGPGHHGLEAAQMISSIMSELPMLRPLVVVLKQFLIERSLLEAYTGMYRGMFCFLRLSFALYFALTKVFSTMLCVP